MSASGPVGPVRVRILTPLREYFKVKASFRHLVRAMVYPAPDLRYPFLGIHWTKTVHGDLKVGPNAILAFGRESYRFGDVQWGDCSELLRQPAFWQLLRNREFLRLARKQLKTSLNQKAFLSEAVRLVVGVSIDDFERGPAGVRAQLVNRNGDLVDDLLIEKQPGALHVLNAVSPGLACSMAFAEYLCDELN